MNLIVGLGNPGAKYKLTRHNIGFMALDYLTRAVGAQQAPWSEEHYGLTSGFNWDGKAVKLVMPQTFMNLAGHCVGPLSRFYKIPVENILVIQDDLDQPFGQMRWKNQSGDGGHNGIKSLISALGSNEFWRLKLGIGRPPMPGPDVADYVLQKFAPEESKQLPAFLNAAVDAIETFIFEGAQKALNVFNGKTFLS